MSAVAPFDYAGVPADKVRDVRDASARIKVRMSRTAQDIIEIGRDPIAVGALLRQAPRGDSLSQLRWTSAVGKYHGYAGGMYVFVVHEQT